MQPRRLLLNQPLPLPLLHQQQQTYRIYSTMHSDDNLEEEALPEAAQDHPEEDHLEEDQRPLAQFQTQRYNQ